METEGNIYYFRKINKDFYSIWDHSTIENVSAPLGNGTGWGEWVNPGRFGIYPGKRLGATRIPDSFRRNVPGARPCPRSRFAGRSGFRSPPPERLTVPKPTRWGIPLRSTWIKPWVFPPLWRKKKSSGGRGRSNNDL
jgi:hypothetical protein